MEELCVRFSHLSAAIFNGLDNKSLVKCKEVSEIWCDYISEEKFYLIRIIRSTVAKFHNVGKDWENVFKKGTTNTINELKCCVEQFYQKKRNVEFYNDLTPIHVAAGTGNLSLLEEMQKEARENYPEDSEGLTPLHYAAQNGHFNICKALIENMSNKNPKAKGILKKKWKGQTPLYDITPLHGAAAFGHLDIVKFIMTRIEDKYPQESRGNEPLHYAAYFGHVHVVEFIMDGLENKNPRNVIGTTPFLQAAFMGHIKVVEYIMAVVEDKNPRCPDGYTPLHAAASSGHWKHQEVNLDMVIFKGLIQDVIDRALIKQFNDYLVSQGLNPDNITEEAREELKQSYSQSLYPGSQTPPDSMVKVLIADDPSSSIEASALTNPEFFDSVSQLTSSTTTITSPSTTVTTTTPATTTTTSCGCVPPFWEPLETKALLGVTDAPCVVNFGMKKCWSKTCKNNGGSDIYFTGFDSIFLETLLTQGKLKHIGSLPFWYDAFLPNGSTAFGDAFSNSGEDSSLMNSMSEFYNNEHNINLSELNETDVNLYCTMTNLHSTQLSGFSYQFVSGHTNTGKFIHSCILHCFNDILLIGKLYSYRLCFKEPETSGCPSTSPTPTTVTYPPVTSPTTVTYPPVPSPTTPSTTVTYPPTSVTTAPNCCELPWLDATETKAILGISDAPCYANLGMLDGWSNYKCNEAGGYTIHFTSDDQDLDGLFLHTLLSQGEWKNINTQSFWYDLWVRGNDSYAYYAEYDGTLTTLDSFTLFSNNEHNIDWTLTLDPNLDKLYCAVANVHTSDTYGFSYNWIDCDDLNNKALRLCFKPPYPGCSTGKRKKRNTEESEVTSKDNENAAEINADKTDKPAEDQLKTSAVRNTEENEVTSKDNENAAEINADETDKQAEDQPKTSAIRNTEENEVTSKDNENAAEINADETDKPAEDQLKTSEIRNTEENEVTSKDNENAAEINSDETDKLAEDQLKTSAIDSAEATLDDVFVESKKMEKKEKAKQARLAFQTNFKAMNLQKSYSSLFEILWYTQLPCFDVEGVTSDEKNQYGLLKACYWKGLKVPCSKIFKTFPTDQGMCCTFNMDTAEKMFLKGKYQGRVNFMQNRDHEFSFDRGDAMPETWNHEKLVPEAGRHKGLRVILDGHTNMVTGGTVAEDFDGFYAIIDAKDQYPMTSKKPVLIRPGHTNIVSMSPTKVTASPAIKPIDKKERNCFFPQDFTLEVHNNYTQSNCLLECQLKFALSQMNKIDQCLPWYLPLNDSSPARLCDPWEAREFKKHMDYVPLGSCDSCLPDCTTTLYSATVSSAPFRRCDYKNLGVSFLCNFEEYLDPPIWGQKVRDQYIFEDHEIPETGIGNSNTRQFADQKASGNQVFQASNKESPTYDAYEKDIAVVDFIFESSTVFEYRRHSIYIRTVSS